MARSFCMLLSLTLISSASAAEETAAALAKRMGCLDCHNRDTHWTGPAFRSVGERYRADLKNYALSFMSVPDVKDIPAARHSAVIVARIGGSLHIRVFDKEGRRIVDRSEASFAADTTLAAFEKKWAGAALAQTATHADAERRDMIGTVAALTGLLPTNARAAVIESLKKGSKGRWSAVTKGAAMPPFANRLTDAEIARLADWVLFDLGVPSLRVMNTGLGSGTVTSNPAGIDCGSTCDSPFTSGAVVTLTATPAAGSMFDGWEGDATGMTNPITVTVDGQKAVRAKFRLSMPIAPLTDLTPCGIQTYLTAHPEVNTASRFVSALPAEFKLNWLLMTRSESLQTGTAASPRILLPNTDATAVFTIGLTANPSYPGSHPNAVEYMQWDAAEKNFRFHEIVLDAIPAMGNDIPNPAMPGTTMKTFPARNRGIGADDTKCSKCHSTSNVLNNSAFPGTSGVTAGAVKVKNKPNWDAYDSWPGLLAFNRDRIYKGSVEAAAFRSLMNLWTWRANAPAREVIEQLRLQPVDVPTEHVIARTVGGPNDGHINFPFDDAPPVLIEPAPLGTSTISTNYKFDNLTNTDPATTVQRQGPFVTLHYSTDPLDDQGRGVRLFDTLSSLNAIRIADEFCSTHYATSNTLVDVRPIVHAILNGRITIDAVNNTVITTPSVSLPTAYFEARGGRKINELLAETRLRAESLPRRKADLQKFNLTRTDDNYTVAPHNKPGLIEQFGGSTSSGADASFPRLRQEVFRRDTAGFPTDNTAMGGIYVDRETHDFNSRQIALLRYFLEPLGISVDKWSMGVRGRSRTYTFADVYSTVYLPSFQTDVTASLTANKFPGLNNLADATEVVNAVKNSLAALPAFDQTPTFTDVQRIFNKGCIECHGGLNYPPYVNFSSTGFINFAEDENPPGTDSRLQRSHRIASLLTSSTPATSLIYNRIINTNEVCTPGEVEMMPCGGPALSHCDINTIARWITGGQPFSLGDPHLRTINGVEYDFQAAGEFVYLRDENFELQVRQVGISTAAPVGPNAHTGLTSCVSVNGAVAIRFGRNRLTYQPGAEGMEVRINGKLTTLPAGGITLPTTERILPLPDMVGIRLFLRGGTSVTVTATRWDHFQIWYLNIDLQAARATDGLLGLIAPGNWLPAMPDGSQLGPRPEALADRHKVLYAKFGDAWRVNDGNSLFDYAVGTSAKTFSFPDWPGFATEKCIAPRVPGGPLDKPPQEPIPAEKARQLIGGISHEPLRTLAMIDVMATGEAGFAKAYAQTAKLRAKASPEVPALLGPALISRNLSVAPDLAWSKAVEPNLTYALYVWPVDEELTEPHRVPTDAADHTRHARLMVKAAPNVKPNQAYYWKVVVDDGQGGLTESEIRRFKLKP